MSAMLASLFLDSHWDLLRRILSTKTKAGATTAHRHAEILQLRNTILRSLSELRKSQRVYMPGVISILDEMQNGEDPDDSLKLWLPSEVSADDRDIWCLPDIPFLEFRFRFAQANDCLAELRRLRRLLQGLQDQNAKHPSSSQNNVTRSQGLFEGFKSRIQRCASRYSHARDAMLALDPDEKFRPGWTQRFQKLNESDIRGPGRERDDKSEGQFVLSWIWLVPRLSHPPQPPATTAQDGPVPATNSSAVPGTEMTTDDEPTPANEEELADSMRVHWAKCQARAERYEEEVLLTIEEMGRTLNYFKWKQGWWLSLASERAKSDNPPPMAVQRGLRAYAHRQARIYETLIISFTSRWRKALISHGFSPSWLSQFPDTVDPLSSRPSRGHSRLNTEAALDATNESAQTECELPLPDTQQTSEIIDAPLGEEDTDEEEDYVIDEVEGFDVMD